ncbi:MAG: tetratricopeptide repeat protein [Bacteroidota bacterium]|nr:tetratricopeptide repeat protein [Bacteroidota bacterium]
MKILINRSIALLFTLCILTQGVKVNAQKPSGNYVDSIYNKAISEKKDTNQLLFLFSESSKILKKKPNEAKALLNKSLKLSAIYPDKKWVAKNKSLLGTLEYSSGNFNESEKYYKEALDIYSQNNNQHGLALTLNNMASLYRDKGDYAHAVENYLKSLKIKEELNDKKGIVNTLNNLANLHVMQSDIVSAKKYYIQAKDIAEEIKNPESLALTYSNLANIYFDLNDIEKSFQYDTLALHYRKKLGDKSGIAISLNNIASYYLAKKEYKQALQYINESLKIKTEIGDKQGVAVSKTEKGNIFLNMSQPDSAIFYFLEALDIAKSLSIKKRISVCYQNLAKAYSNKNDFEKAYYYERKYSDLKDTLSNENYQKNVSEMETKYDTDKKKREIELLTKESRLNALLLRETELEGISKAKEIELLNKENELSSIQNEKNAFEIENNQKKISLLNQKREIQELEIQNNQSHIKQQKIVFYFIITGFLLALGFAFFIFKSLKKQRQANRIISKQKEQVEEKSVQIHHQKELLEEKQKEILDSIHYAKRIQNTLLAHKGFVDEHIKENFILFKPKDIVSGDFYWAAKHGNNFYLAACDSTGHGVPGAFMSLLNINFLNEAINEKDILEPNLILNFVRKRLITSISKDGQKDGFDGILLRINEDTKEITYAAANNAPILISGGVIQELGADRMPVGQGERQEGFQLFTVNIKTGDTLYLYTDGYADQFGGLKGKKFKYKPLNELILSICNFPFDKQSVVLNEKFEDWRGELEQVDDVCIIGIRM